MAHRWFLVEDPEFVISLPFLYESNFLVFYLSNINNKLFGRKNKIRVDEINIFQTKNMHKAIKRFCEICKREDMFRKKSIRPAV